MSNDPCSARIEEREIFLEALDQPTPEIRRAFLDRVCDGKPVLRKSIESLLRNHKEDPFLETPVIQNPRASNEGSSGNRAPNKTFQEAGDRIGRFKLLQEIGGGGCGVVFMAEQEEGVRRRVALKIIKLGMDTKSVIARFEAERQALAMMDHPNIARVLDAGATETGRPYFVMELVRGVKISEYCDQNHLTTIERLNLFIKVCQAVQHAHQKGIIHRDIKPSNILVTLHDGEAVPKVIDFGIAKAINQRLTEKTLFTEFQSFIGTPAYTSPEQAEMSGLDIDTRTDIYSLGVLLYEMLTGRTPFDGRELAESGLDNMRRTIREEEPLKPSARLRTLAGAEMTTTAQRRRSEPARLTKLLRGDLDWIVMKALEKDRTRRYETASALGMDVQRYLSNEPVLARPPSGAYQLRKFAKRHRFAFATASAFALALFIGLVVSAWQYVEKGRALTRAVHAEAEQRLLLKQADAARRNAEIQEVAARRRAYAADINLIQQALAAKNLGRAQALLDAQRPPAPSTAPIPTDAERSSELAESTLDFRGWEWRYLWQHCQSDALFTLCQLTNEIEALSVSYDGKWVAMGEWRSGGLSIWDVRARQEVARLADAGGAAFAFSPVAPLLAFVAAESREPFDFRNRGGRVRLWDAAARRTVAELPLRGPCRGLAFSADGKKVLTATGEGEYAIWSVPEGGELATFRRENSGRPRFGGPPAGGAEFAVTRDLSLAASAFGDGRISVSNTANGRELWTARAADERVTALAFSPDGKILASSAGFVESAIRLWSVETGNEIARLEGHRTYVRSLVFWPDGEMLASGSGDQTINLWNLSNLPLGIADRGRYNPEGRLPIDAATLHPVETLRGHKLEVWSLALMPDGVTLVSGCKDGSVLVWDTTVQRRDRTRIVLPDPVRAWSFAPDSQSIFALSPDAGLVRWHGPDFQDKQLLPGIGTDVGDALFSDDGRLAAISTRARGVRVWNLETQTLVRELNTKGRREFPVAISSELNCLVTRQGPENSVHEWDLATGLETRSWRLEGRQGRWPASGSTFSAGGKWWLSLGGEGEGHLRNLAAGTAAVFRRTLNDVSQVELSPDGEFFVLASRAESPELWGTNPVEKLAELNGFLQGTHSIAFSPDSRRLALGSNGKEAVKLWDTASHRELLTLEGEGSIFATTSFSPDGNLLASQNARGTLYIWRAPSFDEIERLETRK